MKFSFWGLSACLFVGCVLLFGIDLSVGTVAIPYVEVVHLFWQALKAAIFSEAVAESHYHWTILKDFRLPKAITAVLAGAALSVSGLQMQTFFRNPLAGPFVLGISSGASLGVALLMLFVVGNGIFSAFFAQLSDLPYQDWLMVGAAFIGAALVLMLMMLASLRVQNNMALLIVGLMFGSMTSALVSILQYVAEADKIKSYLVWTWGSLGHLTWEKLGILAPLIGIGLCLAWLIHKPLDALLLGEAYAESMGMGIKRTRLAIILINSLLAGCITAFCGPISFIGIAVPHLAKLLLSTSQHRYLIPTVALIGAMLVLGCDIFATFILPEQTLPINIVTALLGAPLVIWVILRKRRL
ncbi:FecCD family ABC transporter permease [Hugenholtzia roseola]|uniref:FecCD family ABC transporter permease n=1 Tax=Hugenholtzia roseola TaxID=1002 RepID=UPI00054D3FFA|nr:iron ABC transporter permease [Hugenholtzia roseola]